MKRSRFTQTQIVKAIQEHEGGRDAKDICRELGITTVSFYKWRQRYGGLQVPAVRAGICQWAEQYYWSSALFYRTGIDNFGWLTHLMD